MPFSEKRVGCRAIGHGINAKHAEEAIQYVGLDRSGHALLEPGNDGSGYTCCGGKRRLCQASGDALIADEAAEVGG